jgi:hypothetical protein
MLPPTPSGASNVLRWRGSQESARLRRRIERFVTGELRSLWQAEAKLKPPCRSVSCAIYAGPRSTGIEEKTDATWGHRYTGSPRCYPVLSSRHGPSRNQQVGGCPNLRRPSALRKCRSCEIEPGAILIHLWRGSPATKICTAGRPGGPEMVDRSSRWGPDRVAIQSDNLCESACGSCFFCTVAVPLT